MVISLYLLPDFVCQQYIAAQPSNADGSLVHHSQLAVVMQCEDFQALPKEAGRANVKHPLLDKVRRCSAQPEEAAEFFALVLFPGVGRLSAYQAQHTHYLKGLRQKLTEHYERNPPEPCETRLLIGQSSPILSF